jgi:putative transposase
MYSARLLVQPFSEIPNMAAVGNPYEERKGGGLLQDAEDGGGLLNDYCNFAEAQRRIGEYIEEVYNQRKLRSNLGYLPPIEFDALHALKAGS